MAILSSFPSGAGGGDTLSFTNIVVSASDWDDSNYSRSFPYEAVISLSGVTENHFPIVAFYEADDIVYHFMDSAQTGNGTVTIYAEKAPAGAIIIPNIACREMDVTESSSIGILEDTSWDVISLIAQKGKAGDFWSIGDTKSVTLNGTVGTLSLNTTLYVYIIGINHEGKNGITWQGFKTAATDGKDVVLVTNYGAQSSDGTLNFNMNHWGSSSNPYNTNHGGWKGCDLRYDILGSTDIAPSGYGATATWNSRVGYDASVTTATSPVSNTLMAALPSSLRAVMRPMTVYTDNCSASPHNAESYITTSIDYLPLLAEYEVFGAQSKANSFEQNYQTQYTYYANGGSKEKYRHSLTSSSGSWQIRSPYYYDDGSFCCVNNAGNSSINTSTYSYGLSPMFLV